MKVRTVILIMLFSGIAACFLGKYIYTKWHEGEIRFSHPSERKYPVRGIDVSHHQGTIDWKALQSESLDFVFMKATEGGDFKDRLFRQNWNDALRTGLDAGAYHFYRFEFDPEIQAGNFLASTHKLKKSLPPVLDVELHESNRSSGKSRDQIRGEINQYLAIISENCRCTPIVYTEPLSYHFYLKGLETDYTLWMCGQFWPWQLSPSKHWKFMQYTQKGRLKGIEDFVDLDLFRGTLEEYETFKRSAYDPKSPD
jgi:lysozyme